MALLLFLILRNLMIIIFADRVQLSMKATNRLQQIFQKIPQRSPIINNLLSSKQSLSLAMLVLVLCFNGSKSNSYFKAINLLYSRKTLKKQISLKIRKFRLNPQNLRLKLALLVIPSNLVKSLLLILQRTLRYAVKFHTVHQ